MEHEVAGIFGETVSRDEVTAGIRSLKPVKSAGPDKIISEMLKHANERVIDFLSSSLKSCTMREYSLKNGPNQ